ncbi:unnamed protein product [Phytomonas sp. Hart1]|nr:unnamed protein product [Phytomonas sp. Hart1]|eukprot:CCW72327.1 unnamed protein product [Phytomonas sp. isolate Hart1]
MSNLLFRRAAATRGLRVFTYTVVPLAPTVGVLQWVDHAIPFGAYLTGDGKTGGAHGRYFPDEPTSQACAARLAEVAGARAAVKKRVLLDLYAEFSPALHYFFWEGFAEVGAWWGARRAFTDSAAAASLVGYVVGLGDRHGGNLLLHRRTAEWIHVDLGIAFDQSRMLPIPEQVPFRLTRNVVDGLGVEGVGGGFAAAAEAVLWRLRERRELLLAILDAVVQDPLTRWAIRPFSDSSEGVEASLNASAAFARARRRRGNASAGDARRTLARVADKLAGVDGNEQLGVGVQVRKLIQDAQSVENLSMMFRGWSPWL